MQLKSIITGCAVREEKQAPGMLYFSPASWECRPYGDGFFISMKSAPNIFHRAMQHILLGVRYKLVR